MFDIITDSACDLTPDTARQLGVEVVPFYVSLDGEHYRKEGVEIPVRDFYQFMVDNPAAYPKTSLASIEDFEQIFRAHAEAGHGQVCSVKANGFHRRHLLVRRCAAGYAEPYYTAWDASGTRDKTLPGRRSFIDAGAGM